ncbi:unannotated protein [freshwater metagenome]|uniref:Unannotated protein n=1 Tax=freshwater metagenome TaxID=449393 RepID=A0A6J6S0Y5_9ZZZZ
MVATTSIGSLALKITVESPGTLKLSLFEAAVTSDWPSNNCQPPLEVADVISTTSSVSELLNATTYSRFSLTSFLDTTKMEFLEYRSSITPLANPGWTRRSSEICFKYAAIGLVVVAWNESPFPIGVPPILFSVFQISTCVANISCRANWSLPVFVPVIPTSSP